MGSGHGNPIKPEISCLALPAVLVALSMTLLSCKRPIDWDSLTLQSVSGSLHALEEARLRYEEECAESGPAAATQVSLRFLQTQSCTRQAGTSGDNSVWVYFKNGLLGLVTSPLPDTAGSGAGPDEIRSGGVCDPGGALMYYFCLLSSFHKQFGKWDAVSYMQQKISEDLGGNNLDLYSCSTLVVLDESVRVTRLAEILEWSPGLFYWNSHGGLVPITEEADVALMGAGVLTGEWYTSEPMAELVLSAYNSMYEFTGPNRYLFVGTVPDLPGRFYLGVLPAFVSRFANFDTWERYWNACPKALAYVSSCHSGDVEHTGLRDAFLAGGADGFLGWNGTVTAFESWLTATSMIDCLLDTFTLGEAHHVLSSLHPKLEQTGNRDIMLRGYFVASTNGGAARRYVLASAGYQYIPGWPDVTNIYGYAQGDDYVEVRFPGVLRTGTFNIARTANAQLVRWLPGMQFGYYAMEGWGSGTLSVRRYDSCLVSGTFAGTLRYHGNNPPPAETLLTLSDGYFKCPMSWLDIGVVPGTR